MTDNATYEDGLGKMLERVDNDIASQFKVPDGSCFLRPTPGRVIVAQDLPKAPSKLIIAPQRALARPTTGRVIACGSGTDYWLGKRVLYGTMSGMAVQFKNRPAWIALTEAEIVAEITLEDAEIDAEKPLPLDESYA
jgi:co-chaperonin GroES (HSP10)